jgi:3-isopropylmalate/(R)-2-methylmalate dehydratase large subunit
VTWGTSPQQVIDISKRVPGRGDFSDAGDRTLFETALKYIGVKPESSLTDVEIDTAFIGSCTNARLSDLRAAAEVLKGRKVASSVRAVCVPGSMTVRRAAEAEGLDKIFIDAGFEWHESGCGLCGSAGDEDFAGKRVISTTNRNFEGRQGTNTKTHLASPATVAASAIAGKITTAVRG